MPGQLGLGHGGVGTQRNECGQPAHPAGQRPVHRGEEQRQRAAAGGVRDDHADAPAVEVPCRQLLLHEADDLLLGEDLLMSADGRRLPREVCDGVESPGHARTMRPRPGIGQAGPGNTWQRAGPGDPEPARPVAACGVSRSSRARRGTARRPSARPAALRAPLWRTPLAAVLNRPMVVGSAAEGSALGAAALGLYALGRADRLGAAGAPLAGPSEGQPTEPADPGAVAAFAEMRHRIPALVEALAGGWPSRDSLASGGQGTDVDVVRAPMECILRDPPRLQRSPDAPPGCWPCRTPPARTTPRGAGDEVTWPGSGPGGGPPRRGRHRPGPRTRRRPGTDRQELARLLTRLADSTGRPAQGR